MELDRDKGTKSYLITGATGYIGSMLVKHIRETDREARITALVRDREKAKSVLPDGASVLAEDHTDGAQWGSWRFRAII